MPTEIEIRKMRKLIDYGRSCYNKGMDQEAVDAFRQVFDNIPFESRGQLKGLLEQAYEGLCELHSSPDEYTWERSGVLIDYLDWREEHIPKLKCSVFKRVSQILDAQRKADTANDGIGLVEEAIKDDNKLRITPIQADTSDEDFKEDLREVGELLRLKWFDVCLIGLKDEIPSMEKELGQDEAINLYTIDFDEGGFWKKDLKIERDFNAIVLSSGVARHQIIKFIQKCKHLNGVPLLINAEVWTECKNTDRLMYCSEYMPVIKDVLKLYCKASLVSKYITLDLELSRHTILHTGHVQTNILLSALILEKEGYDFQWILDLDKEEIIKKINACCPSLFITDINRHKCDGYQVAESIRQISPYRHLPMIALSAMMGCKDRVFQALNSGFTATAGKPVIAKELTAMARQLIMLGEYLRIYDMVLDAGQL